MAWLRIDDRFTSNNKVSQLTDAEFRVWMRTLCHCASSRDPSVDAVAMREVAGLTRARVNRFRELGLLDKVGGDHEVHDWEKYQPRDATNADRQAAWRARKTVTGTVTPTVTNGVTEPVTSSSRDARVPAPASPSRPLNTNPSVVRSREQHSGFKVPDILKAVEQ